MSVLQTMRDKAGTLLAVVIGVALIGFVLGDFLGGGSGQNKDAKSHYEIAVIDGQSVSYQEFDNRAQNLEEIYKMSGTSTITEAMSESIREQIWNQIVEEKILGDEITTLGLGVSPEEVDAMVLGDKPHPIIQQLFANRETGVLDKSFLVNFLKTTEYDPQAKAYWLFFEDEIVTSQTKTKLTNLISKGLYVTSKQVEYEAALTANTVDFSFVSRSFFSVPDTAVVITDSDIDNYYNKHKEEFRQDAARSIEYVEFEVLPSDIDISETEKKITEAISEFASTENPVQIINLSADTRHFEVFLPINKVPDMIRDFVSKENKDVVYGPYVEDETYKIARIIEIENRPDSVHARHILLTPNKYGTKEAAGFQADSILNLIENGSSFEVLAQLISEDGSSQLGGDLGWFSEGQMVTPFNNVCFEGKKEDLIIAETTFGFHIIEILDQSKTTKKYHIGIIDRAIEPSSSTYQNIYSKASRFAGINNTYDKFSQTIIDDGLNRKNGHDIGPDEKVLAGLESPRYLIMSLYETKENEIILDRSEQAVFELDNKFVVAYCTDVKKEGFADSEDVESDIRFALLKEKKAEKLIAGMKADIMGLENIEDISSKLGLTVQEATGISFNSFSIPGAGIEPAIISYASNAEEGFLSVPIKGDNGIYIISVNTVNDNSQMLTAEILKIQLTSSFEMRAVYEAIEALRKGSDIVDKRYKFY
ncbi:MAG: SurA N-terminal domain-containing protein [Bacteroidales bacterium]|nr:SurA N-terminal domain-containing protein [Bacteroidales bacterium]